MSPQNEGRIIQKDIRNIATDPILLLFLKKKERKKGTMCICTDRIDWNFTKPIIVIAMEECGLLSLYTFTTNMYSF